MRPALDLNQVLVLANGCFDGLHEGHRYFLSQAAQLGYLLVRANDDASVRKLKGKGRPIHDEQTRLAQLQQLGYNAALFNGDSDALVAILQPDIIARGYDQHISPEDKKHLIVLIPQLCQFSTSANLANSSVETQNG